MAEVQWYYARNDQQFGPVSATELRQLADAGRLAPDDLLWREGMESWATAINLRGLFIDPSTTADTPNIPLANVTPLPTPLSTPAQQTQPAKTSPRRTAPPRSLQSILRTTQIILWSMCVLVVLAGVVLFTRAFMIAKEPAEEAAAGTLFSTFFIGAYVLARCGEKLSKLLLAFSRRHSR